MFGNREDSKPDRWSPVPTAAAIAARIDETMSIDGYDIERAWASATRYSDFRQFQPRVNVGPTQRTKFCVAYDERNLCVFVRMFVAHPDSIMRSLTRRDVRGSSDQVKIMCKEFPHSA